MKTKILVLTFLASFVFMLTADAVAQESRLDRKITRLPGTVSGEIAFKEVSGNAIGTFKCSNLIVRAAKLGGGWGRASAAYGDFSKRHCRFVLPSVPAGESFVALLNAKMPSCDQKSFNTTTSFPMTLKSGEALKYNFEVIKINCVLVK